MTALCKFTVWYPVWTQSIAQLAWHSSILQQCAFVHSELVAVLAPDHKL
jgi:hypothetical protein